MKITEVRIIEPQEETISNNIDYTSSEVEALLYKYSPELYKKQEKQRSFPKPAKRFNADADYKPSGEFYDVKYSSIQLDNEEYQSELNLKIEIKSDMPL